MKIWCLWLLFVAAAGQAAAALTETFDSAASAAANGWVATGNGVDGQVVGWINTNEAGGIAGEAQYDVKRGGETSYLDTTLDATLNGNVGFSASGNLNVVGLIGTPDLGNPPVLGFQSSPTDFLGIFFRGDADDLGPDLAWGLRFVTSSDGIRMQGGGDASRKIGTNVARTFALAYDPNAGTYGTVTASITGAGAPISIALNESQRDFLNAVSYNGFGLSHPATGPNIHTIQLRLDNLTYGVIPEPSSLAMQGVLLVAFAACRGRFARSTRKTVRSHGGLRK
jgi:hypothetical protein